MKLLPQVKTLEYTGGHFCICYDTAINVSFSDKELLDKARYLAKKLDEVLHCRLQIIDITCSSGNKNCISIKNEMNGMLSESYKIICKPDGISITGDSHRGTFYGIQTLLQIVKLNGCSIPCFSITDSPDIAHRGFYHDVTRGKVPKIGTLMELAEKCASYKINELQLYVEHSFAFRNIPELSINNDPITAEEIIELDRHCKKHCVDLIPSLATFGHMYEILRVKRLEHLNELDIKASEKPYDLWDRMAHYTLDPLNDESLSLVTSMLEEYIPLFSSKYFNICCDETFDLGKGRNSEYSSKVGCGRMYVDFLKKIISVVRKNGKTPMFWGDIVLHHPELIKEIPEDTIFLNWGYSADVKEDATRTFAEASVKQYVCPGVSGWSRFANEINLASENIRKMIQFGKKYNCPGVLNTDWGDCGHVNFLSNSYHGMIMGAALSWNTDSYKQNSEFDSAVSALEWMDKSGQLVTNERELGSLCSYNFGNFYAWVKKLDCLWNKENSLRETSFELLEKNYQRAKEISSEFRKYSPGGNLQKQIDFEELVWSADAISWALSVLMFKKVYEFGQVENVCPVNRNSLISQCSVLCQNFRKIWRKRNKESELFRVTDIFKSIIENIDDIALINN